MSLSRSKLLFIAILIVLLFQPVNRVRADVIMNYFKASVQTEGILLEWETSSESNNSGFYILRSTKLDLDYTRINIFFLSDSESGEGVYYSYLDDEVIAGTTYYYKLEAIDLDSSRDIFGPVAAGILIQTPTSTITATPVQTGNNLTSTPTPSGGITSTPTRSLTPTRTEIIYTQITQAITPTPTISETVSVNPTGTPTLEPLPTIEYLFPAPTATSIESSTPILQIVSTEISPVSKSYSRPLSTRYLFLLGVVFLLWVSLLAFLVLLMRKLFQSVLDEEDGD